MEELNKLLIDSQQQICYENRVKNKIIIALILVIFIESIFFFSGFIYYESQFEKTETVTLDTKGENANIDYSNITGNQYNATNMDNK